MYTRVTLLEIDTMRISVEAAAGLFEREVLPRLRLQEGYKGSLVLATPEGKGIIITFWENEDAAMAAAAFATGILDEHVALFRSPPGRDHYRVAVADLLAIGVRTP